MLYLPAALLALRNSAWAFFVLQVGLQVVARLPTHAPDPSCRPPVVYIWVERAGSHCGHCLLLFSRDHTPGCQGGPSRAAPRPVFATALLLSFFAAV
jgi:hypothetical protein